MEKKLIYVVEDDYLQFAWTRDLLRAAFGETLEIEHIATHHAFLNRLEEIAQRQPDSILLDVMLPWTDTEMSEEPSSLDSFMTAGIQCWQKLQGNDRTARIPVLISGVLDRSDLLGLPKDVSYLRKDAPDHRVVAWLKEALSKPRSVQFQ